MPFDNIGLCVNEYYKAVDIACGIKNIFFLYLNTHNKIKKDLNIVNT